jgi:competence protein ComEA
MIKGIKKNLGLTTVLFGLAANAFAAYPVNINNAGAEELSEALKGVGLKKAEAIVDYRDKHGDFESQESLSNVKGIGLKTVEKNKEYIMLK